MNIKRVLPIVGCMTYAALNVAHADDASDLKARFEALESQLNSVKSQLSDVKAQLEKTSEAQAQQAKEAQASAPPISMKPGSAMTFQIGKGEVTLYGHADLSLDEVDNGLSGRAGAQGHNGWLPQISSNNSLFGIKGSRPISDDLLAVFQLEADVQFAATPGNNCCTNGGTAQDSGVKGALGSRNSYLGIQGNWGAVKLGKNDAPYKNSTQRMDPFQNSIADYRSIMGNSGGDNRVEFATRVPHAIWYESPNVKGFSGAILYSPGQNRAEDNSITARGEPDCTGGNIPGGEGCNDGAFGDLWSGSLAYTNGPLYATLAYEHHSKVNRSGDELGASDGINPPIGSVGVADENAMKVGLQYRFDPTRTTVGFVWEKLKRNAPSDTFNERTRNNALYLSLTQKVFVNDEINAAWAHAGKTPGDPGGVVNQPGTPLTQVAGPINNQANMFALGYKHFFDDNRTSWYVVATEMLNKQGAHYDLGAGGHGAVVDCKDGAGTCFSGTTIRALSTGLIYDF